MDFIFQDMKPANTVMIPFSDGEYLWKVCMLMRSGEYVGRETALFFRHVQNWMKEISAGRITR